MKTTRQCHATRYSNEPSAIISCMYCSSPAAVWWQLSSTVKLNCPSVMLITHYRNPVGCSSAGTNVCSGQSAPSLCCFFFYKCLRFSEIGAGSEPALNVIRVPTFSVKHFAPPLVPLPPVLFSNRGVWRASMLSFFDSVWIWPRASRKRSQTCFLTGPGGNCVISKGRVVKNNWAI